MRRILPWLMVVAGCGGTPSSTGDDTSGDDVKVIDAAKRPDAAPRHVKFVVLGDTGDGNKAQREVGVAIRDLCAAEGGCDFALLLGDNIYDTGVTGNGDPGWQEKFELPYYDVEMPFYAALGNHDYGGDLFGLDVGGLGNEFDKAQHEIDYTQASAKWKMPAAHYTIRIGHIGIIVLDTNAILWDDDTYGDMTAWWPTALSEVAGAEWVFVAGHHPFRSNGTHGNAGDYDAPELAGIIVPNPLPIQDGNAVKDYFEDTVCGTGQVYFSGHDHSRQWLDEADLLCGTEMIVSGAGSKITEIIDRGNEVFYEDATKVGFLFVEVDGDTFTGKFYDSAGNVDFERSFQHP